MPALVRRESKRFSAPKLTIGFIVDGVQESYQWSLLAGIADTARNNGAHVVCLVGDILEGARAERNSIFDLARRGVVDGLIIASGAIGNRVGAGGLAEFCERFRPLPMCSIAMRLPGLSSVSIDNAAGVRVAVQHLVNVHDRRRLAFVRGPIANVEAEIRYEAYVEALRDEGITLMPELVVVGDFEERSGANAVKQVMSKRPPDAIMAANDMMALGALDELTRMGVRVPEQIVVAGFDDIEQARFSLPPLTTMRQPLYEQGGDAVRTLLAEIRNGAAPDNITRHTEMVVRRSCGCLGADVAPIPHATDAGRARTFEALFIERRQLMLAGLSRASHGELGGHAGDDWSERLLNAFAEQMRNPAEDALVRAYDDLLRRLSMSAAPLGICNDIISALRVDALRCIDDPERRTYIEGAFHKLRIMTAEAMERAQAARRIDGDLRAREVGRAAAAIASALHTSELETAMLRHMEALDVRRCHVVDIAPDGTARVVLSVSPTEAAPKTSVGGVREMFGYLMDAGAEHMYVTYALTFDGTAGTILLLKVGATNGYVCETIADVFAAWYRTRA